MTTKHPTPKPDPDRERMAEVVPLRAEDAGTETAFGQATGPAYLDTSGTGEARRHPVIPSICAGTASGRPPPKRSGCTGTRPATTGSAPRPTPLKPSRTRCVACSGWPGSCSPGRTGPTGGCWNPWPWLLAARVTTTR